MIRVIATALCLASAASSGAAATSADRKPFHLTIAAGKVGEVCMPLAAGDTLAWRFKSNAAADFNLHHHVGSEVLMPVQRTQTREDRGEHAIDRDNEWCLMWTAPAGQRLTVEGAWSVRRARAPAAPR
jgi:hypothetical protein